MLGLRGIFYIPRSFQCISSCFILFYLIPFYSIRLHRDTVCLLSSIAICISHFAFRILYSALCMRVRGSQVGRKFKSRSNRQSVHCTIIIPRIGRAIAAPVCQHGQKHLCAILTSCTSILAIPNFGLIDRENRLANRSLRRNNARAVLAWPRFSEPCEPCEPPREETVAVARLLITRRGWRWRRVTSHPIESSIYPSALLLRRRRWRLFLHIRTIG